MDNQLLVSLTEKYGSPLYVYDAEKIVSQYNRITNAFASVKSLKLEIITTSSEMLFAFQKDKIEHVDNNNDSYHDTTTTGELEIIDPHVIQPQTGQIVDPIPEPRPIAPEPVGMVTMGLPYIITDPDVELPIPEPELQVTVPDEPMDFPETMSEYNGGVEAMFDFINTNVTYPKYERSNNIEGNVYVKFIVEKDGSITNPVILKSVAGSKNFDAEVIRIINKMPNWKPGEHRGKSVRSNMTLPIRFVLKN